MVRGLFSSEVNVARGDPPIVGAVIITTDGRYLCNCCYQDDDTAILEQWMPSDVENYPCECDGCGQVLIHESQEPRE